MPRLDWNAIGSRFYEVGVDRGVLYVADQPGVVWTGLTSVSESSSGGDAKPFYLDGIKYSNNSDAEEFQATITAFTYPPEFGHCDGTYEPRPGLFLTQQRRQSFGLSYRTKVGSDSMDDYAYKIHLVYNALASPSEKENNTLDDSIEPMDFSWSVTTRPPNLTGYNSTSHIIIDSRSTDPMILSAVEDILYGNDSDSPRIPTFEELIAVFDTISTITVTDNGDGTFTVEAPFDVIRMLDPTTFAITAPSAVVIDDDSYTLSST